MKLTKQQLATVRNAVAGIENEKDETPTEKFHRLRTMFSTFLSDLETAPEETSLHALPEWQGTEVVRGFQIGTIDCFTDGSAILSSWGETPFKLTVDAFSFANDFFQIGDYAVVYRTGTKAGMVDCIGRDTFEKNYTLSPPQLTTNFTPRHHNLPPIPPAPIEDFDDSEDEDAGFTLAFTNLSHRQYIAAQVMGSLILENRIAWTQDPESYDCDPNSVVNTALEYATALVNHPDWEKDPRATNTPTEKGGHQSRSKPELLPLADPKEELV